MERQHNPRYDAILDKFDSDQQEPENQNTEPTTPQPQAPAQQPAQSPADDMSGLPPLPPLAEDSDFKRLLKLSGI
jgi:type II secretory pathway component PulK